MMNALNFQEYLRRPSMLFQLDLNELRLLLEEYPYCQNLHYLLAKKGQLENLPEFKKYLGNASVYSPDRAFLFTKIKKQSGSRLKSEEEVLEFGPLPASLPEEKLPEMGKTSEIETSKPMISFEEENSIEIVEESGLENEVVVPVEEEPVPSEEVVLVENVTDNEPESGNANVEEEVEETVEVREKEGSGLKPLSVLEQMLYQGNEGELEEDITAEIVIEQPTERIIQVEKIIKMEEFEEEQPESKNTPQKELNQAELGSETVLKDVTQEENIKDHSALKDPVEKKHMIAKSNKEVSAELKLVEIDFVENNNPKLPDVMTIEPVPEQKECEQDENGPRINLILNQDTTEHVKKKKNKEKAEKKPKKTKKALKVKEPKLKKKKKEEASKDKKKKKKKKSLPEFAEKSVLKYDDIASETLAKLLAQQGSTKAAIEIYKRLCILNTDKTSAYKKIIKKLKKK